MEGLKILKFGLIPKTGAKEPLSVQNGLVYEIYSPEKVLIPAGSLKDVDTGLIFDIPDDCFVEFFDAESTAKRGLKITNRILFGGIKRVLFVFSNLAGFSVGFGKNEPIAYAVIRERVPSVIVNVDAVDLLEKAKTQ